MKKILVVSVLLLVCIFSTTRTLAQTRTKLTEYVTMVNYGDTYWLEDDKKQMCISLSVSKEQRDRRTNEMMYKVVCGDFTRTVVKWAVEEAIEEGIKTAAATQGSSLILSVASYAAGKIYEGVCDYWGESFE